MENVHSLLVMKSFQKKLFLAGTTTLLYDRISFSNDLRGQVSAVTEENKASV
jgi:hypothetical protein